MDKTLIAENSATVFMRYRYQLGQVGALDLLRGAAAYLQYKAGILDIRSWTRDVLQQFRGQLEEELAREARRCFEEMILPTIYPEAEALVREHLRAGHVVAIVSGATRFAVEPIAARLGIDHCLYTQLEIEDGRVTGRVIEPICFEEGKIYWIQNFIEARSIDLAKSYFYTDSVTDLPLLDLVGHPVAVNPDPRLHRIALRRRWPLHFFEPPVVDLARSRHDAECSAGPESPR
jgi:HAD superfamily hydrolase (TIGR01490 family)